MKNSKTNDKAPIWRCADFYVATFMLVVSAVAAWQIASIEVPQSRLLPIITLMLLIASAACLLWRTIRGERVTNALLLLFTRRESVLLAMILADYLLINILGFYTSAYIFLVASFLYIDGSYKKKTIIKSLIANLVFVVVLYVGFSGFLQLVLPRGFII